ncbi:transmembrane protein 272-like [Physella acuta]|uniref:transmembrane protein 272-like n=1 Tax=Physella acuta TaxID=109671 RepID=UPI0027DC3A5B|nr:transmembrane protein 272-like [Physella acuta]
MENDETRVLLQSAGPESSPSPSFSWRDNVNCGEGTPHNSTRVFYAILTAIPVSMIVIGAIFLHACPVERMIPIYLIVAGCFGCAKYVFNLVQRWRHSNRGKEEDKKTCNLIEQLVNCFLFAWFIAGSVYIYRIYNEVSYDPLNKDHYCHKSLYLFAFWVTTSVYIIMGLSCFCVGYVRCLSSLCKAIDPTESRLENIREAN